MVLGERSWVHPPKRQVASSPLHLQGCSEMSGFRKWTGNCGSSIV